MGANIYLIKQRNDHCLFNRSNLAESFNELVSCLLWPMGWSGLISQILVHVIFGPTAENALRASVVDMSKHLGQIQI